MQVHPPHDKPKGPCVLATCREVGLVVGSGLLILLMVVALRGREGPVRTSLGALDGLSVVTHDGGDAHEALSGKPSVLVFWATWCGACVEELPDLSRLAAGGHAVLAISREPLAKTGAALARRGLSLPLASDPKGEAFAAFEVEVLPTIIVFDASGDPVELLRGGSTSARLSAHLSALAR